MSPCWFRTNPTNCPRWRTTLRITMVARLCMTRRRKKVAGQALIRACGPLTVASIMEVRPATPSLRLTGGSPTRPHRPGTRTTEGGSMSPRDVQLPSMGGAISRSCSGGIREFAQPTAAPVMASYPPCSRTGFTTLIIPSFPSPYYLPI